MVEIPYRFLEEGKLRGGHPALEITRVSLCWGKTGPTTLISALCASFTFPLGTAYKGLRGGLLPIHVLTQGTNGPSLNSLQHSWAWRGQLNTLYGEIYFTSNQGGSGLGFVKGVKISNPSHGPQGLADLTPVPFLQLRPLFTHPPPLLSEFQGHWASL